MSRKGNNRNARYGKTSKVLSCDTCHSFHLWIRIFLHWELSKVHRGLLCKQVLEVYTRSIFWAHHRSGSTSWAHIVHIVHRAHPVYHFCGVDVTTFVVFDGEWLVAGSGWSIDQHRSNTKLFPVNRQANKPGNPAN